MSNNEIIVAHLSTQRSIQVLCDVISEYRGPRLRGIPLLGERSLVPLGGCHVFQTSVDLDLIAPRSPISSHQLRDQDFAPADCWASDTRAGEARR